MTEPLFHDLGNWSDLGAALVRLLIAAALGALVGLERESRGKAAGLRTHMLVTVGACLFVLTPLQAGVSREHLTRVIQGLATGIGFLGAGAILQMPEARKIHGLTTAANIWVTAAIGMALGLGYFWPAVLAGLLAALILRLMDRLEPWIEGRSRETGEK
jgi:putative Mg2+ transporter-C (MgtC) family protein